MSEEQRYIDIPVSRKLRHTPYVVNAARMLAEQEVEPRGWYVCHTALIDGHDKDVVFLRCFLDRD